MPCVIDAQPAIDAADPIDASVAIDAGRRVRPTGSGPGSGPGSSTIHDVPMPSE